jgi:TonB family protein
MGFGSPEDLKPFVDRLESDASFRDEVASLMRTIIYRERDGLSWAELMELLAAAVGGPAVADAEAPEARAAVRSLMSFVERIFRTRRNPGAVSDGPVRVVAPEPELERETHNEAEIAAVPTVREAAAADAVESGPAVSQTEMFYRARMAAEEDQAERLAEERRVGDSQAQTVVTDEVVPETVLQTDLPDLHWHVPFEDFEDRKTTERGSPAWLWVAGICALLLAFCAGLFVREQLIVPLRAANTPYEAAPKEAGKELGATLPAPPAASAAQTAAAENASFVTKGVKPGAAGVPVSDVNLLPRYMAPATIGATPAVMAAHLVYAPPPSYPMMAEMTRTQGKVTVEAVVGKNGRVIKAQAIDGHRLLRGAAVRAVKARRYRPYMVNDRPTNVATVVTVDFKLKR